MLSALKSKIEAAKPLGLVKSNNEEFMVIYDGQTLLLPPFHTS